MINRYTSSYNAYATKPAVKFGKPLEHIPIPDPEDVSKVVESVKEAIQFIVPAVVVEEVYTKSKSPDNSDNDEPKKSK